MNNKFINYYLGHEKSNINVEQLMSSLKRDLVSTKIARLIDKYNATPYILVDSINVCQQESISLYAKNREHLVGLINNPFSFVMR